MGLSVQQQKRITDMVMDEIKHFNSIVQRLQEKQKHLEEQKASI